MGVNVTLSSNQLPVPTATSLALAAADLGAPARLTTRTELIAAILLALERILQHWAMVADDAALAVSYLQRCVTIGRPVRILLAGDTAIEGVAETVDAGGRLVVHTTSGRQVFGAGAVVHLRAPDGGPTPHN